MFIRPFFAVMAPILTMACVPETGQPTLVDRDQPYSCAEIIQLDLAGIHAAEIDPKLLPENTRILAPGTMMTMDHNPERLNLETDEAGAVTRWFCG